MMGETQPLVMIVVSNALDGGRPMSELSLEERVAVLEQTVARLKETLLPGQQLPPEKDWKSTIGMFKDDPIMDEIIEEGRKIREEDRRKTRGI